MPSPAGPVETFRRYLTAHQSFDWDGMRVFLAPSARMWYNYRTDLPDGLAAEDAFVEIQKLTSVLDSMEFMFDRPNMETDTEFAVQLTCRATTKSGKTFFVPVMYMGRLDGQGKIAGYEEYLDPSAMADLFGDLQ